MSTNAIAGFVGLLYVDIAATPTLIAEIRDWEGTIGHAPIDSTTHDDNGWESNIVGMRSWQVSAEALYFEGDAGQEELLDRILDGASFTIRLRPEAGSGKREINGTARMTNWSIAAPNTDAQASSIEIVGVGAPTDAVQA